MESAKEMIRAFKLRLFELRHRHQPRFDCPICRYHGPFRDVKMKAGYRKHAACPRCGSLERHRLQFLVLESLLPRLETRRMKMIHFAPEEFFTNYFRPRFAVYETADLNRQDVTFQADMQALPFPDASYDFVFASHVLEHVPDDHAALREIRRILRPEGIAILAVPMLADSTVEYPAPNPVEYYHVRAPGPDYYERYRTYFSRVELHSSPDYPESCQLYMHEDRTRFPTASLPLRPPMQGARHKDIIPVCFAG